MTFPVSTIIAILAGAHMSFATGHKAPTLLGLHYQGGSRQTWSWMAGALGGAADLLAIDLPGFGDAAGSTGYTVAEMANAVAARIAKAGPQRFVLCGHSMGAKVAITLAHRASQGSSELDGLVGLALLAGSPPCPAPMQESKRQEMQGWCAGGEKMALASAAAFVAQNVAATCHQTVRNAPSPTRGDATRSPGGPGLNAAAARTGHTELAYWKYRH